MIEGTDKSTELWRYPILMRYTYHAIIALSNLIGYSKMFDQWECLKQAHHNFMLQFFFIGMVGHMSIGMIIPKLYTFGLLIYLWPYLYMNNTYDGIGMTIPIHEQYL